MNPPTLKQTLFFLFSSLSLSLPLVRAVGISNDDVPMPCRDVCAPVVSVSDTCDRAFNTDASELSCICGATNAQIVIPLCEACIAQNDDDGRDNDVNDLIRSCAFTTTSYDPSSTYTVSSMQAATTGAGNSIQSGATSVASVFTSGASDVVGSATSALASATGAAGTAATLFLGVGGLAGVGIVFLGAAAWL